MKSLRIGCFVYEYPPKIVGGLGTYGEYMTKQMIKLGHDVTVFTMNDTDGTLDTRIVDHGIEIHRPIPVEVDIGDIFPPFVVNDIKKQGVSNQFFYDILVYNILSAAKFLNDLIRSEHCKFDIICAHDWLSAHAGIIIKRKTDLPFVFHIHSTEKGRRMKKGSEIIQHHEKRGGNKADMVITVSLAMQKELMDLGFDPNKIRVCYNAIDSQKYDPGKVNDEERMKIREKYGIKPNEKMIFFIGRLTYIKGVRFLVEAMPIVLRDFPEARLVIVGKGDLEPLISNMVRYLRLNDKVKMRFEFISEEERIAHYAASDMAVFPSLYEPFGIVALEAMAMAKPVVVGATGTSGFKETVSPSGPHQVGMHINGEEPNDIAEKGINQILVDPDKARKMGENGRERAKEFTWERAAKSTIEIYNEVINQNK